ncbi:zinc-ribbon domain-containing protein (plasmid) [Metabacillus halosaccharovorans]|uniref:zinc-ribbon domain-containing protein n=1 Tax=Metabacillus halosaccharovorans TaxID=930124 RepID=UPI002040AF3A|nr:zinc-ribbon domain-containing protein [Metabacillus halosaccharovorans]MCM3441482.1 zinc-ribbon domain-containing protein [Metabacillus halosaccharovorans]
MPKFTFSHPKLNFISYKRSGEPSVNECLKEVLRFLKVDENIIKEVNILQDTLPILKQLPPVEQKDNLGKLFPELEKEWHFEKKFPFEPQHFKAKSNYKVWWKCENGHDFDSKIISRTKGHGCRFCTGNDVTKENSLAHLYPSIASEWDYDMNGELTPENISAHSNSEVFWKCPNCHSSYDNSFNARTGGGENNCLIVQVKE